MTVNPNYNPRRYIKLAYLLQEPESLREHHARNLDGIFLERSRELYSLVRDYNLKPSSLEQEVLRIIHELGLKRDAESYRRAIVLALVYDINLPG